MRGLLSAFTRFAFLVMLMRACASAEGSAARWHDLKCQGRQGRDWHFLQLKLEKATERARLVLKDAKRPKLAHEVRHRYEDKYLLAESLTASAIASQVNHLALLGVSKPMLERLQGWTAVSSNHTASPVLLKIQVQERCHFLRKETREVDASDHAEVTEVTATGGADVLFTKKRVKTVEEFFWHVDVECKLSAQKGVAVEEEMVILARSASIELKTSDDKNPRKGRREAQEEEMDISWLLKSLSMNTSSPVFSINRTGERCFTPRRNPEVAEARDFFRKYVRWASSAEDLVRGLMRIEPNFDRIKAEIDEDALATMFVPVLPLLQEELAATAIAGEASGGLDAAGESMLFGMPDDLPLNGTSLLSTMDITKLLAEEMRILTAQKDKIKSSMAGMVNIATAAEAFLVVILAHSGRVAYQCLFALWYIEDMMERQLVSAIGKEISPADFAEYMGFHSRKLFNDAYVPVPFTYAVRRSTHHRPEGTLSVESTYLGSPSEASSPIATMLAYEASATAIHMPLSASSTVTIFGDRYLHGWLSHEFRAMPQGTLKLAMKAKANQFSSFIVVVGRMTSPTAIDGEYAAIVQNKDEITIPLELSTIPAPQEFQEAIASLSPVQEEFARAFRSMQLEGTLFGILIIQIKPQLEKALNLTADSLTKNIKLTQDLMQLFIKYQIPTDLLSYDASSYGDGDHAAVSSPHTRLAAVKEHVAAMMTMIDAAKNEELEERRREACYQKPLAQEPRSYARCGSSSSVLDCTQLGSSLSLRSFSRMGSALSVLDFTQLGSSLSLRSFSRRGSALSVLDFLHLGSSLSVRSFARTGSVLSILDFVVFGSSLSVRSMAPLGQTISITGASRFEGPDSQTPMGDGEGRAAQQNNQEPSIDAVQVEAVMGAMDTDKSSEAPSAVQQAQPRSRDYTKVPADMNEQFERLDVDAVVRPAILKPGDVWSKKAQEALLANTKTRELRQGQQAEHKAAAFHLLDALTKSGALAIQDASLHVMVAASHGFDKDIIDTVVYDNVNPIEKVERSMLIMAATVHRQPVSNLIASTQQERVRMASPMLFADGVPSSRQDSWM